MEQDFKDEMLEDYGIRSKWDYENPTKNIISKKFKERFYVEIRKDNKGKPVYAITSEGIKALALVKGYKELKSELIVPPTRENDFTAVFKATVVGYRWSKEEGKLKEDNVLIEVGDANPKNCKVSQHYIRMASTRAIARVLKNYVGIGLVCIDELKDISEDKEDKDTTPATENQIKFIEKMFSTINKNDKRYLSAITCLKDKYGLSDFKLLTKSDCMEYISIVKELIYNNNCNSIAQ